MYLLYCEEFGDSVLLLFGRTKTSFDNGVEVTATPSGIGVDLTSPFRVLFPNSDPLEPDPGPKIGVLCRGVSRFAGAEIFRSERSRVESNTPKG